MKKGEIMSDCRALLIVFILFIRLNAVESADGVREGSGLIDFHLQIENLRKGVAAPSGLDEIILPIDTVRKMGEMSQLEFKSSLTSIKDDMDAEIVICSILGMENEGKKKALLVDILSSRPIYYIGTNPIEVVLLNCKSRQEKNGLISILFASYLNASIEKRKILFGIIQKSFPSRIPKGEFDSKEISLKLVTLEAFLKSNDGQFNFEYVRPRVTGETIDLLLFDQP